MNKYQTNFHLFDRFSPIVINLFSFLSMQLNLTHSGWSHFFIYNPQHIVVFSKISKLLFVFTPWRGPPEPNCDPQPVLPGQTSLDQAPFLCLLPAVGSLPGRSHRLSAVLRWVTSLISSSLNRSSCANVGQIGFIRIVSSWCVPRKMIQRQHFVSWVFVIDESDVISCVCVCLHMWYEFCRCNQCIFGGWAAGVGTQRHRGDILHLPSGLPQSVGRSGGPGGSYFNGMIPQKHCFCFFF